MLLKAKFAYNNMKNLSIGQILFKLNYNYHFQILYKNNIDLWFKSKSTNNL